MSEEKGNESKGITVRDCVSRAVDAELIRPHDEVHPEGEDTLLTPEMADLVGRLAAAKLGEHLLSTSAILKRTGEADQATLDWHIRSKAEQLVGLNAYGIRGHLGRVDDACSAITTLMHSMSLIAGDLGEDSDTDTLRGLAEALAGSTKERAAVIQEAIDSVRTLLREHENKVKAEFGIDIDPENTAADDTSEAETAAA